MNFNPKFDQSQDFDPAHSATTITQNFNPYRTSEEAMPPLKLLPFGGFEVAVLLSKLHDSSCAEERNGSSLTLPIVDTARSGWLRTKMLVG